MAQYNSISMPTTPMYPDRSFEGRMKKGFKKLFSIGKKKSGSLSKSRSGSGRGSSSRVEEEGQRSSRRFRIFKFSKNKPVDDNPDDNLTEDGRLSITDSSAQQAEDGGKLSLMGQIKNEFHIHTDRHHESAPKEEHKTTQLDPHAGNANKQELKKIAGAEAVGGHAVKKFDPSPAHGEAKTPVVKEGKNDQHHHQQQHKGGEATTTLVAEGAEDATPDHPLEVREPNGCETMCKGLQRVCLPWTVNKDD